MDVYPSLAYRDVEAALEYLQAAFGFEPVIFDRDEAGQIRQAALRHGQGVIAVSSPGTCMESTPVEDGSYIVVEDPGAQHARAKAAGADVLGDRTTPSMAASTVTAPATPTETFGASERRDPTRNRRKLDRISLRRDAPGS